MNDVRTFREKRNKMHRDTFNGIVNSPAMKNAMKNKHFIDWKHLDTRKVGYFHVLVLWFDGNLSDKRIETIRKKLISYNPTGGEFIDRPTIIKFYGTVKQLVLS